MMSSVDVQARVLDLCTAAEGFLKCGQWAESKQEAEVALAIARDHGLKKLEAHAGFCLGASLGQLGKLDEGLRYQRASLQTYRELNDILGITRSLENIGIMVNDTQESLAYAQESASVARSAGLLENEAIALVRVGTLQARLGNIDAGVLSFESARDMIGTIADTQQRDYRMNYCLGQYGRILCGTGEELRTQEEVKNGIQLLDAAIACAERIGKVHASEYNRTYKALGLEKCGDIAGATHELANVEKSFYSRWQAVCADELRVSFRDSWLPVTVSCTLQRLHLMNNQAEDALLSAERNRAWAFSALLAEQHGEAVKQHHLQWKDIVQLARSEAAGILYYSALSPACINVWAIGSDGCLRGHLPLSPFEKWTDLQGSLSDLVQIVRGDVESYWREGDADTCNFNSDDGETSNTTQASRGKLQQLHQLMRGADEQLAKCYDMFFRPVAKWFSEESHMIIVPDGELFMLPFAALRNTETRQYLIESHTVRYAPSLAALHALRDRQRDNVGRIKLQNHCEAALVVGIGRFPRQVDGKKWRDLPAALVEATEVSNACQRSGLKVDCLLGNVATKASVLAQLPAANTIAHICTHGLVDQKALILHCDDGSDDMALLKADEIQNLHLSTKLGVLSACDTGRGSIGADGVVGLSRSFLAAGMDSVVVTLWQIGDRSTCEFMRRFYRHYFQDGRAHIAAQQAMCDMLTSRSDAGCPSFYPAHWAPFVCIGAVLV